MDACPGTVGHLTQLDYSTAGPARDAIASLITVGLPSGPVSPALQRAVPGGAPRSLPPAGAIPAAPGPPLPGPTSAQETARGTEPARSQQTVSDHDGNADGDHDGEIIAAAAGILADARQNGERLSQKALAGKLRRDGYRVASHSLRGLLAAASGQVEKGSPPEPGMATGGPAAVGRPVNGSYQPLASWLPGHEPGSGPAGPPGAP